MITFASFDSQAFPTFGGSKLSQPSDVTTVAGGCGLGWHRGPWLPKDAIGRPVFEAVIPDHWSHDELMALLLTPPVISDEATRRIIKPAFMADDPPEYVRNYPAWEVGARHFGSEYLAWPKKAPKLAAGEPPH